MIHQLNAFFNRVLPASLKRPMRHLAFLWLDLYGKFKGDARQSLPTWMPLVGSGDFTAVGEEYFGYFVELGRLQPTEHVLDIGCGLGRMAFPLTRYLDRDRGRYLGFDIEQKAVQWCQRYISKPHPQFAFECLDISNSNYVGGKKQSQSVRFPCASDSFDFVIATSLFTHMLPEGVRRYFAEIGRVLRFGGRGLLTFFLLNPEAERLIATGQSQFAFTHAYGNCRVVNPRLPESAIAYPEAEIQAWLHESGLRLQAPIHYGAWCGRTANYLDGQDILIIQKA